MIKLRHIDNPEVIFELTDKEYEIFKLTHKKGYEEVEENQGTEGEIPLLLGNSPVDLEKKTKKPIKLKKD